MAREVKLKKVKKVITQPEVSVDIDTIVIKRVVDVVAAKKVIAFVEQIGQVLIWEDQDYIDKGDWTIEEVQDVIMVKLGLDPKIDKKSEK